MLRPARGDEAGDFCLRRSRRILPVCGDLKGKCSVKFLENFKFKFVLKDHGPSIIAVCHPLDKQKICDILALDE